MCGTPNYISPEIATRAAHGLETDVWGLGVMLYTLLVGRPPFDTDDGVRSTLTRVVMSDVKIPSSLSIEARDLINSLLRKNPKDRLKLSGILNHPFMTKNHFAEKSVSRRSSCCDSGVSCSNQSSMPSLSSCPSSGFRPHLSKGQTLRPKSSASFEKSSGHRFLGKDSACSSPNSALRTPFGSYTGNTEYQEQIPNSHFENCSLGYPINYSSEPSRGIDSRENIQTSHCLEPAKSYHSGCSNKLADKMCSHVWKVCTQCSHIDSCPCQPARLVQAQDLILPVLPSNMPEIGRAHV